MHDRDEKMCLCPYTKVCMDEYSGIIHKSKKQTWFGCHQLIHRGRSRDRLGGISFSYEE